MSTAMLVRQQQHQSAMYSSSFPTEIRNAQQSTLFVKRLLAVAISNITYLRAIFPEEAFKDRSIYDLNLKVLCEHNECEAAATLIKWLQGSFDALEKKYLRQLTIGIFLDPKNEDPYHALGFRVRTDSSQFQIDNGREEVENISPVYHKPKEHNASEPAVAQEMDMVVVQPRIEALSAGASTTEPATQMNNVYEGISIPGEADPDNSTSPSRKGRKNAVKKNKNVPPEKASNRKRPLSNSKQQQNADMSTEINSLSQKTTSLSLNAVKKLSLNKEDMSKNSSTKEQPIDNRPLRNKRSVAVKNHNAAFQVEFIDSQEFVDETLPRRSKRHKASASCSAISA